ncbi:hypothetical protein [Actinokineospora pegani]|uniref:hypothetical protein n=1 Tax=Actinokineospora pegani TaxID=2654637 RepID=UPI0012EA3BCE|nr:hypothetical protein [Actinokineospora pegani]
MAGSRKSFGTRAVCALITTGATAVLLVLGARVAVAADSAPLQSSVGMPFGTVGIAAVVVGVGGIIFGLLRRKKPAATAANTRIEPVVIPLQVPTPRPVAEPADR